METIKRKDAFDQGYTKAIQDGEEYAVDIDDEEVNFDEGEYLLVEQEGRPFSISKETLERLLESHLEDQEDVYDEMGSLNDLISEKNDFIELATNAINKVWQSKKWYYPTSTRVTE